MLDDIDLKDAVTEIGATSNEPMKICGVEISVRPEIILRGPGQKGQSLIGAIKLQLSASIKFDKDAAGYVSATAQEFCKRSLVADNDIVYAPYCQIIDIGHGIVYPGVKSTKQRMRDIESECQNIAAIWPTI